MLGNGPRFPGGGNSFGQLGTCGVCDNIDPSTLGNIVWWDDDLDGLQDPSEPGIPNVTLELWLDPDGSAQGNNPLNGNAVKVAETTTDALAVMCSVLQVITTA
ncbi:MAG: SdrD B-like domain-containing protein [Bacteroidota bacterium]